MSLNAPIGYAIPDETVRVALAAFPNGNLYMRMRDELGPIYTNHAFAHLFPPTGQPAEDPARLALVLVMQFVEGLPDRQAADAVRARLDWKYALALELTDPGFDASVLSEFRSRLIGGSAEELLLTSMLDLLREGGLLKARGKQRTDSTHVLAAIRTLNRLTGVGETLRHALNELAALAPSWLRAQITPDWFDRYSRRYEEYHLPKATTDRLALAATIGADGFELLTALYAPNAPAALRELAAVQALRQMWIQQYYAPEARRPVRWREEADSPPPPQRIHSPYDLEARYSSKGSINWVGYKVHLTETCDDDAPHVITQVLTTLATTPDDAVTATIHQKLATLDLLPIEHLVDSGYTDAELLVTSRTQYNIDLVGPVAADGSWQAKAAQGFDLSQFAVDWEAQSVRCPQGKQSVAWRSCVSSSGQDVIKVRFGRGECAVCSSRAQCTTAKTKPREVTLRPQAEHTALQAARQRQTTAEFTLHYARRAGVESLISQGVRAGDLRRTRYIGLARTHLQQILMAVGISLVRVVAWLADPGPAPKRQAHFAALAPTG